MTLVHTSLLAALWAGLTGPVAAGTLSRVSWKSHSDTYVNNTIVDGTTSPLGFTATNDLAQPFLNAPDSTVALTYGSYYAISFHSYGAHTGPGTVSFLLDGVTEYSQSVTFPDPTLVSGVFASFALPGGDTVALSATGLAADRIRIVADGPGLAGDGVVDAFYQFNYARAVAPALTLVPAAAGQAAISWTPATPGFGLQESGSLSPAAWTNSASGATNPIVVPATPPQRFFRLVHP